MTSCLFYCIIIYKKQQNKLSVVLLIAQQEKGCGIMSKKVVLFLTEYVKDYRHYNLTEEVLENEKEYLKQRYEKAKAKQENGEEITYFDHESMYLYPAICTLTFNDVYGLFAYNNYDASVTIPTRGEHESYKVRWYDYFYNLMQDCIWDCDIDDEICRNYFLKKKEIKSFTVIKTLEKKKRNEMLEFLKNYGFSIRYIERLTGVSRGIIQNL